VASHQVQVSPRHGARSKERCKFKGTIKQPLQYIHKKCAQSLRPCAKFIGCLISIFLHLLENDFN
jgi:hypothetical protein